MIFRLPEVLHLEVYFVGSCAPAKVQICGAQDAQKLQDLAAERCSMTYRAPELFHVESYCVIDQRVDIWVFIYSFIYILRKNTNLN